MLEIGPLLCDVMCEIKDKERIRLFRKKKQFQGWIFGFVWFLSQTTPNENGKTFFLRISTKHRRRRIWFVLWRLKLNWTIRIHLYYCISFDKFVRVVTLQNSFRIESRIECISSKPKSVFHRPNSFATIVCLVSVNRFCWFKPYNTIVFKIQIERVYICLAQQIAEKIKHIRWILALLSCCSVVWVANVQRKTREFACRLNCICSVHKNYHNLICKKIFL